MKSILHFALCLAWLGQGAVGAGETPALQVEKSEIDAGEVLRGETARFCFVLKNAGRAPLEITAKPNCGCTVAKYDKIIAPGEQGKVEAEVRTAGMKGKVHKTITLSTNDPAQPELRLTLTLQVTSLFDVDRPEGKVLRLKQGETTREEFLVKVRPDRSGDAQTLQVTGAAVSARYAKAAVEPVEGQKGVWRVTLSVDELAPSGRSWLTVSIATNSKSEPSVQLRIPCEKGIIASPTSVYLGRIDPESPLPVTRSVILRRPEGPFKITKLESSDPTLQVLDQALAGGLLHRVSVSYAGGASAGLHRGKLRIETDDPSEPAVEVETLYMVAAGNAGEGP